MALRELPVHDVISLHVKPIPLPAGKITRSLWHVELWMDVATCAKPPFPFLSSALSTLEKLENAAAWSKFFEFLKTT